MRYELRARLNDPLCESSDRVPVCAVVERDNFFPLQLVVRRSSKVQRDTSVPGGVVVVVVGGRVVVVVGGRVVVVVTATVVVVARRVVVVVAATVVVGASVVVVVVVEPV